MMAFLCFFCRETDVLEWHDVEDGVPTLDAPTPASRRRSCGASGSGSGLRVPSGQSSSPSSCRIVAQPLEPFEPFEPSGQRPPRPVNKRSRSRSAGNKGVRFLKVDIRLPRQEGAPLGSKKVIRLVKIDVRPRPNDAPGAGFASSPSAGWPFKQQQQHRPKAHSRREIRDGSESPDVGFFNSPSRDWARILRLSRPQQEIQEQLDVGFFASPSGGGGWAFKQQRPTRSRQEKFEAPSSSFGASPSAVWGGGSSKQRRHRSRKEIYDRPSSSSGGRSSSLQSPSGPRQEIQDGLESPDTGFLSSPVGGWATRHRPHLYRRRHGASGEIKPAG
ncbi:hypothetical protein MPTK1_8g13330 [Marchantia polymorpha subsp. ruderalis]|uniref:Uncharacterized protein n=1 Tax=Marchantia polymorpha TaxID=3197 RepID=A0A2R6WCD8_MARPO|nr:hypothetical protein MARPO_0110s0014 [Marchantia polymorpha]BBN19754.1 hypothetical protein Mp_8g13330 [Marchantia polymorpha subsp. ruderalis]|eukprot:PTQ31521.1 hypothetical protein MARPO_0110s0014 [Marchantia polymorpha]